MIGRPYTEFLQPWLSFDTSDCILYEVGDRHLRVGGTRGHLASVGVLVNAMLERGNNKSATGRLCSPVQVACRTTSVDLVPSA